MRLKSLYIEKYKNIKGKPFDFSNNTGYIALIGLNGSGKSNLIEAICIIFDKLINNNGTGIPFEYKIEYELNGHSYLRGKNEAKKDGKRCSAEEVEYPSSLIACYSGEDLRLWQTSFEKYHMGYFNSAVKSAYSTPRFLYVNKYCWKIALISLICSNKEKVKKILYTTLNINDRQDVEISFIIDESKKETFKNNTAISWFNNITQDGVNNISLKTIASYDIYESSIPVSDDLKDQYIFNYLYLLSQPKKNKINKIDKLIDDISIILQNDTYKIDFNDLSEGEKKLILIECITEVLGDKNSLVLFDEPDAHTHIAMKKDLLKLISEFEGQTVMTTHSPMFLNKCWNGYDDNNVYYMQDGKIEETEPLKHLAELTGNEIDYFEGAFILSSKKILVVEGKYDDQYLKKAISIFAKRDVKYNKLNDIAIFSANSASAAEVIYNQIFEHCIAKIEKLVFLFDYDDGGWKDGWKKIEAIPKRGTKIIPMFYQDSYPSIKKYPTSDTDVLAANGNKEIKIKDLNSYMVEDLFSENAYAAVIAPVISARKHKDFRNLPYGKNGTAGKIKKHIEKNYSTFVDAYYDGFKPVLDELMNVFDLN